MRDGAAVRVATPIRARLEELLEQVAVRAMDLDTVRVRELRAPRAYWRAIYGSSSSSSPRGRTNGTNSPSPSSFSMNALPAGVIGDGATGSM
jgi:hypothetical protein